MHPLALQISTESDYRPPPLSPDDGAFVPLVIDDSDADTGEDVDGMGV